jgi:hypothetical protein
MNTHTHTAGPWIRSGCTIYAGDVTIAGSYCEGNRNLHACIYASDTVPDTPGSHDSGWSEAWANARLMAAAPELLNACKSALAVFKKQFPLEHGNPEIGVAWRTLEGAIFRAERGIE